MPETRSPKRKQPFFLSFMQPSSNAIFTRLIRVDPLAMQEPEREEFFQRLTDVQNACLRTLPTCGNKRWFKTFEIEIKALVKATNTEDSVIISRQSVPIPPG
jgi:hypothetical protein